jgi:hypothetical protein
VPPCQQPPCSFSAQECLLASKFALEIECIINFCWVDDGGGVGALIQVALGCK